MKKNLNNQENRKDRKLLVLCEFLDGAWDSIRFSIQHLIRKQQGLVLVQAYQKPHMGQSLLNDFTGLQGKFARQELQKLKEKAVQSFDLDEQQIALCPFEGSWQSFLCFQQTEYKPELLLFSLRDAFPGAASNMSRKARKMAALANVPMLFLPENLKERPIQHILYLATVDGLSAQKIGILNQYPALSGSQAITLSMAISGSEKSSQLTELINRFSASSPFPVRSTQILKNKKNGTIFTGDAFFDLIVIDQQLTRSFCNRRKVDWKRWTGKKAEVPLLVL